MVSIVVKEASCPMLPAKYKSTLWSSADLMIPNVSDSVSWKHFVLRGCPILLYLLPGDKWIGGNVNTTQV